ncbi:uncharacterized protein [Nicotiana tomentosiformis]|uniref:uncharacterized protein n=1 Tax=Nicotiana tomentosiformis TaxID=4098 RepID=UPI00388CA7D4
MLKKDAATSWTEDFQKAFDKIKEYLSTPPVLVPPEPGRPLLLYLSVLDGAFGCVLGQHDETGRKEQAIYYLSKKFTPYEARYSLLERTCWKLAKWQIFLSEFDIVYVTQKAVKGQALADNLAENPVGGEYEQLKIYFLYEEVSFVGEDISEAYDRWRMFFDGAANFKGGGITGNWRFRSASTSGAGRMGYKEYQDITISISCARDDEEHQDKNFIYPTPVRIHNQPAYCANVEEEADGNPWFHDIKEYLEKGEYPEHANHTKNARSEDCPTISSKPTYEWFHPSQEDTLSRILLDDYGNRLHPNRMSRAFNKRVKPRQFTPEQLVLKRIFPHQDEAKGKFSPNRQGPYIVHRVLTGGSLILVEMDGEIWPKPINSDAVKRYHVQNFCISSYDVIELRLT